MILEPSAWQDTFSVTEESVYRTPLPEEHVAVYGDSAEGRASFLTTRVGESQLISGFRYFEVFLILRNTGEFVLVDRVD